MLNTDVLLTLKSFRKKVYQKKFQSTTTECRETSTVECMLLQTVFTLSYNVVLWISRFATVLSQWKGSPRYQVEMKFCWFQRLGSNFARGSHQRCSIKKGVLKNFAIFTGKHLRRSLFLSSNFIKKVSLAQVFSSEFTRFLRTPVSKNTSGWLLLFYNSF